MEFFFIFCNFYGNPYLCKDFYSFCTKINLFSFLVHKLLEQLFDSFAYLFFTKKMWIYTVYIHLHIHHISPCGFWKSCVTESPLESIVTVLPMLCVKWIVVWAFGASQQRSHLGCKHPIAECLGWNSSSTTEYSSLASRSAREMAQMTRYCNPWEILIIMLAFTLCLIWS